MKELVLFGAPMVYLVGHVRGQRDCSLIICHSDLLVKGKCTHYGSCNVGSNGVYIYKKGENGLLGIGK